MQRNIILRLVIIFTLLITLNTCIQNPGSTNNTTGDSTVYKLRLHHYAVVFENGIQVLNDTLITDNIDTIVDIEDDAVLSYTINGDTVSSRRVNNLTKMTGHSQVI